MPIKAQELRPTPTPTPTPLFAILSTGVAASAAHWPIYVMTRNKHPMQVHHASDESESQVIPAKAAAGKAKGDAFSTGAPTVAGSDGFERTMVMTHASRKLGVVEERGETIAAGTRINQYEIIRELARGGMG
ncbi:MAG: hypothetical protein AAGC55_09920, partial [Myxococcota bacterium]